MNSYINRMSYYEEVAECFYTYAGSRDAEDEMWEAICEEMYRLDCICGFYPDCEY